jgi:hypothetical protein
MLRERGPYQRVAVPETRVHAHRNLRSQPVFVELSESVKAEVVPSGVELVGVKITVAKQGADGVVGWVR